MEIDFLDLSSKEADKQEANSDGYKEMGCVKGSGINRPFLNDVSALPHLMSFKVAQDDGTKKTVSDSPVSPRFLSISTPDHFDSSHKHLAGFQKLFNYDKLDGNHYFASTSYALPHDQPSRQHFDANRVFPVLPTIGSANWNTRSCVKASGSSAPLIIFYGGLAYVYDDISPEKAQSVMLFAGNGSSIRSNRAQPTIQVQAPISKAVGTDNVAVNPTVTTPICPHLSSPLSVSSYTGSHWRSGSRSTGDAAMAIKTTRVATAPVSELDTQTLAIASPAGSVTAYAVMPSVPQARKVSLARFLERRKERMTSVALTTSATDPLNRPSKIQRTGYL